MSPGIPKVTYLTIPDEGVGEPLKCVGFVILLIFQK